MFTINKKKLVTIIAIVGLSLISCSVPVTKVTVQSFEINRDLEKQSALSTITNILVDRGYDIKMTDKDAGIITTEYKKYASLGDNPPFDYFMNIKVTVRNQNNELSVKLIPAIKAQNRLNAAAFTEYELGYYEGEPKNIRFIDSMKPETGWRKLAQLNFMNVVSDVADAFGMSVEEVTQNVTKTSANAISAK